MRRVRARWFLPNSADVLGLLGAQADVTVRGLDAFARWAAGDAAAGDVVRTAEHEADVCRRELVAAVRDSFTTPIEPEDLFHLSSELDDVINRAKNTVREADALGMAPNEAMAEMCGDLASGVRHLSAAFADLCRDPASASTEAAAAIKDQRNLERAYRSAMPELIAHGDLPEVAARQELYRRLTQIADAIVTVADRVVYATVKES
jgi:uncharacterized protein Yka (UPF0111/DUF47 family)